MTNPNAAPDLIIGLVDGAIPANTRRFTVVLAENAVVQLDELVACTQTLPGDQTVTHYGIVVEGTHHLEGASYASDTARIARDLTMPGITARRVEVQILRTTPELWLAPDPGAPVRRATGIERDAALFVDQMDAPLAVGLDQAEMPVFVDFSFLNGEKGGHVNISGISGVATKTTYALFLLYQILETPAGRALLGAAAPITHGLVFNVKGEDLMQIDRTSSRFDDAQAARWQRLGVDTPRPFTSVRLYAPRAAGAHAGSAVPDVHSRPSDDVIAFGFTPRDFIRRGLLRFCFSEAEDMRTQVGFVEQRVRVQLARHMYPLRGAPGAVVLASPPPGTSFNFDRLVTENRSELDDGDGAVVRDFSDLVAFIADRVDPDTGDPSWTAGVQPGTSMALLRRLYALVPRLGHLVTEHVRPVELGKAAVSVVDLHTLHHAAQRFVVGALLSEVFEEKQSSGREPLRFVVLDELNKYAPREGTSPLKELLIDIAERGRALGVLLIGAQQAASAVDPAITRNAAIKVVGRLDAAESAEYRFLSPELRERATRFLPGTMVLDQPIIPAPIPFRFPFPPFATNVAEGRPAPADQAAAADAVFDRL